MTRPSIPHGDEFDLYETRDRLREVLPADEYARTFDPANPAHGEDGHFCVVPAVMGGQTFEELVDLALDNAPREWFVCTREERADMLRVWAEEFMRHLEPVLILKGELTPGDSASHAQVVHAIGDMALKSGYGKPPQLALDALGVSADELPPAVLARHDQLRAEKLARVMKEFPSFRPAGQQHDPLAELARDAVPEGMELWDGVCIPVAEAERFREEEARCKALAAASKEHPMTVELGATPFILIRVDNVEGMENLGRLRVQLGGGAEMSHMMTGMLTAACTELLDSVERARQEQCAGHHGDEGSGS